VRLAGRPWFQRLTDGRRTDLATWREERGLFHLTVAGGLRMVAAHALEVVVEPGVELQGDLFGPGVVSADPLIRVGDAVLVTREGALVGVGEAVLPGRLMTDLHRGLAVKVRHRYHEPSGAPTVDS
jgi:archaeosine synthase